MPKALAAALATGAPTLTPVGMGMGTDTATGPLPGRAAGSA